MPFNALTVSSGVDLTYSDSGPPSHPSYTTIFAIHGSFFNKGIFQKLQSTAYAKGYRFVSISRRPYAGSTPFNADELDLINGVNTSAAKRAAFVEARGHELASFIDIFTQTFKLPPLSEDGKKGGSILLGWSMGSHFVAAVLAHAATLPLDTRARLVAQLRSVVIYDTSSTIMGLTEAPKNWSPLIDPTLAMDVRSSLFGQWVSSYFDHGDYSNRDPEALQHALPSIDRVPTIFTMSPEEQKDVLVPGSEGALDFPYIIVFQEQVKATFVKAFGSTEAATLFPNLKIKFLAGDRDPSFVITAVWAIQDELESLGMGGDISYKFIAGANHFMHWDDPEGLLNYVVAY